jgi:diguanylate cyclase (GGDEF)-like protein
MTALDLRSFNLLAALLCACMGAVMLGVRRNLPVKVHGLGYWGVAPLFALGSTIFFALEGPVPAWVVAVCGNGLLLACTVALLAGSSHFFERPWRWWPWGLLILACQAVLLVFFLVWPDYRPRQLAFAMSMAVVCAAHVRVLARHGRGFAARIVLVAMAWQTCVLVVRGMATLWIDTPASHRFDAVSVLHLVYVGTFSFSVLLVLIGAQLMASERVRMEFEHLATHDELTGLFNRRALLGWIEQAHALWKREGQRYALMLLDLDHFKHLNDNHGHLAGDRALANVAATLQQGLGSSGRLGRYGGEEFVLLLPATEADAARCLAERLRQRVESMVPDAGTPACTVTIGLAAVQAGDDSVEALIGRADQALYQAKAAGRNRVGVG